MEGRPLIPLSAPLGQQIHNRNLTLIEGQQAKREGMVMVTWLQ